MVDYCAFFHPDTTDEPFQFVEFKADGGLSLNELTSRAWAAFVSHVSDQFGDVDDVADFVSRFSADNLVIIRGKLVG